MKQDGTCDDYWETTNPAAPAEVRQNETNELPLADNNTDNGE